MLTAEFRPKTFDDVAGQKEIVASLKEYVDGDMPNLLFYGNPGVGKTTLAHIIGREMFGDSYQANFYDMNASSDRGIDIIRDQVLQRAKTKTLGSDKPKIIFLDECDSLTKDAQTALRRIMEDYYKTCRFLLSCNYVEKVIPPLRDRCTQFHFKDLTTKDIAKYLWKKIIPNIENKIDKSQVIRIAKKANGSVRQALNLVEQGYNKEVSIDIELLSLSVSEFQSTVYKNDDDPLLLLQKLHREIVKKEDVQALIHLAEADFRMSMGTNKMLQLIACFSKIKGSK